MTGLQVGCAERPHEVAAADRAGQALAALVFDEADAFPRAGVAALAEAGLLLAPFPAWLGGEGLANGRPGALRRLLGAVGRADLALGRLYEGHVNAVALAVRYGTANNVRLLLTEAEAGRLGGVWMAGPPLRLERATQGFVLHGAKILCSGCNHIRRPLVAADHEGGSIMLLPGLPAETPFDLSRWTMRGMQASATGTVEFTGLAVAPGELLGQAGDYLRAPFFRGGAWRVLAVQLGGLEAVYASYATQLDAGPHREHPLQLARFGEATVAIETARLWVERAADLAELPGDEAEAVDAFVDLARNAFEGAALTVIARAQKAIGLKSLQRPNPLERMARDLETYLRQPALDASLLSAAAYRLARHAPS